MKDFKKKKIRGFKRHKRNLEYWKQSQINLNLNLLQSLKRDYVKVWIHPFYSLRRYNIPNWYKREVIQSLIEIAESWNSELITMNISYYLSIWLFKKDFMHSQVVVAIDDMILFYNNTFEEKKSIDYLDSNFFIPQSTKFCWQKGITTLYYDEKELNEYLENRIMSKNEVQDIKDNALRIEKINDKNAYILKDDDVYIASYK